LHDANAAVLQKIIRENADFYIFNSFLIVAKDFYPVRSAAGMVDFIFYL